MMKMSSFFLILSLLLSPLHAQVPSFKLQWDQSESLAVVNGFSYTLKIDSAPAVGLTPTCSNLVNVPGLLTRCTAPLPTLTSGQHVLVLTAFNAFGATSADPIAGGPPSKPMSITVTVTIVVP